MDASQELGRAVQKLKLALVVADATLEELMQVINAAASGQDPEALNALVATFPEFLAVHNRNIEGVSDALQSKSPKRGTKRKTAKAPKRAPQARLLFNKKYKLEIIAQRQAAGEPALPEPELQALAQEQWLKLDKAAKEKVKAEHREELENIADIRTDFEVHNELNSSVRPETEQSSKRAKLEAKGNPKTKNCVIC